MSKVWTSEELARECKNCEVASAGRIRSQAETIRQLREKIAQLNRDSICRERVIRGLKHAVKMACTKRDDQARALDMKSKALHTFYRLATLQQIDLREIGDRLEVLFGQIDGTFSPPGVTEIYNIARKPRVGGCDGCKLYPPASTIKESLEVAEEE